MTTAIQAIAPSTASSLTAPAPLPSENIYASLFLSYIHQSLAESLVAVHSVTNKLSDEERVQACHILDFGLRTLAAWPQARDLTIALAPYVERSGHWGSWRRQLERALELADLQSDNESKISLLMLRARIAQRQGWLQETIFTYRRVILLARQSGNRFDEARACTNLGYLFIDAGCYWRAAVLCHHALALFEQLQNAHGLAHTHNHLGLLYTRQGDYAQAEQALNRACALWQRAQDHHRLFLVYTNLGLLYIECGQPDQALNYLEMARAEAEISGEQVWIAKTWNNLGLVQIKRGDLEQAESYFTQAHAIFSTFDQRLELANTQHNLGLLYQYRAQWQAARPLLESAQTAFADIGNRVEEMKVLVALTACAAVAAGFTVSSEHRQRLAFLLEQETNHKLRQLYLTYCTAYLAYWDGEKPQ
ncbi:MAG: tetratricopeptide repeat protein [Caldilineaceae bacterium]